MPIMRHIYDSASYKFGSQALFWSKILNHQMATEAKLILDVSITQNCMFDVFLHCPIIVFRQHGHSLVTPISVQISEFAHT